MDPLSINDSVLSVIAVTLVSINTLRETVERYKGRDKTLGRLQDSLLDLVTILNSLEAVAHSKTPVLTLLKGPVGRCAQVCREFDDAMKIFSRKSTTGLKDWTKMEFKRGDINEFIDTLADYKSTITIGLGTITMHASILTRQVVEEYNETIKDTVYNLEMHLQRIDETITRVAIGHPTVLKDSGIDLQDEKAMTEQCLRVCERASSFIKSLQDEQPALQRDTPQQSAGHVLNQFEAQRITQNSLQDSQDNLLKTIGRLRERLDSISPNSAPDDEREMLQLREEINVSKQCLEICRQVSGQESNQKMHISDVIANEDCDSVVVTTLADLFNTRKVEAASRSAALVGSISADLLRDISKDRYGSRFGALEWSGNMDSNFPEFPKVLSRETDVKTLFSKDSGYSSMVSKAHQPNSDDGQEICDSAKWESESVASVKNLATMNTVSSANPTAAGGAAVELAEMLVKDESICSLIKDGYKHFESDRFERNLRRILKKFAFSLRREARNDLEKSAIRLIHNYRAFIIIHIKKCLELPDGRHATSLHELQKQKQSQLALERFLELLPGGEEINAEDQVEQNESGSDVDSDLSNDEQPYLPALEKVKLYLLTSTAYSEFKQKLTEFVRPSCITYHLSSENSTLADIDFRSGKVVDVGEGDLATEESEVLGPISDTKSDVSSPKLGSSPLEETEVVWNTVLDTLQQNERERLRTFDIEELSLKELKPKHRRFKEVLLLCKLWVIITLTRLSLALQNRWAKWTRRPVGKGWSRIEWTCACGHDLFADFNNKSLDTLKKYASILQRLPNGNSHSTTSQPSTNYLMSPSTAHLKPNSSGISIQPPQGLNNLLPISASQTLSVAANNERDLSFLELCVNTGPHLKSLAEIDTGNISTDGALFQAIRKQYLSLRGFRSRFWLLKPAAISFVRFSLENRHRVGILQKPLALPPKSEVDAKNWIYDPCPLEGDPPIAEDLFLHYLQCNEGSSTLFWMLRFPRRLEASLLKSAALATFGWGIHIDEGPDFAALFKANFLVLVFSGAAAGLWKFFEHDFQGAFGFACVSQFEYGWDTVSPDSIEIKCMNE